MKPVALRAPLLPVFLCQCVDNLITFLMGGACIGAGMTFFSAPSKSLLLTNAGPSFWLGVLGLFAVAGVFHRAFFILLTGRTVGGWVTGLRPALKHGEVFSILSLLTEGLQVAFPALWLADFWARRLHFRFGLDYAISYGDS